MPDVTPDSQGILNVSLTMRMVYQRAQQTYMNWHPPPRVGPPMRCLMRGCEFVHVCFGLCWCESGRENTVSESTVSNTELSEFFCAPRVPGRELSEFLSAYFCMPMRTHRVAAELPQTQRVLSHPKQHSRNSIPPVSYTRLFE